MADTDPTTARAQRQAAARDGRRDDAVDRRNRNVNPGGSSRDMGTREGQIQRQREIADEIDIDRDGVGAVERIGQGLDVFLRSTGVRQFGANVRQEFAAEADFVQPSDVNPRVDGQAISAEPQIPSDRRPDVADRARREVADDDRFAEPGDFEASVGARGVEDIGLTEMGGQRRAGRQFEAETALRSVDPTEDIRPTDDGFGLTDSAQQRQAARGFEAQFDVFDTGDLDTGDVREFDGGFGLGRDPARRLAADRIDSDLPGVDVGPGDIDLERTDSGFEAAFETEVQR